LHATDADDLVKQLSAVGLAKVQLALGPLRDEPDKWKNVDRKLADAGMNIVSGMVGTVGEDYSTIAAIRRTGGLVPDDTWPQSLEVMKKSAPVAAALKVKRVSFHAGFIPAGKDDPVFNKVVDRLGIVADVFKAVGCNIFLETGQETAPTLHRCLKTLNRPDVGVNFDPANMLLYRSGDPIEAMKLLLPYIVQFHVKDAIRSDADGKWGKEVAVGTGEVDWAGFFRVLKENKWNNGNLVIEREAGDQRVADIKQAQNFLHGVFGKVD
jgi:sugar phosphate isomerase/epimerase